MLKRDRNSPVIVKNRHLSLQGLGEWEAVLLWVLLRILSLIGLAKYHLSERIAQLVRAAYGLRGDIKNERKWTRTTDPHDVNVVL